jgi:hypothetical protein
MTKFAYRKLLVKRRHARAGSAFAKYHQKQTSDNHDDRLGEDIRVHGKNSESIAPIAPGADKLIKNNYGSNTKRHPNNWWVIPTVAECDS